MKSEMKWSELYPEGRDIFYEGDNPKEFVEEMKARYGFDPSRDNSYWNEKCGYSFHCPASVVDEIYEGRLYPLGS
jgi:hypothetical protein